MAGCRAYQQNASAAMGELNKSSTVQFEIESCCLARDALSMHASIASGLPHLGPNAASSEPGTVAYRGLNRPGIPGGSIS
jgi:hypothetical protein